MAQMHLVSIIDLHIVLTPIDNNITASLLQLHSKCFDAHLPHMFLLP